MVTGIVTGVPMSAEEIERLLGRPGNRRGSRPSPESEAVLALEVGQGVIFSNCIKSPGGSCRRILSLGSSARRHGVKVRQWHAKGYHVVVREA